jgi:bla regulator protein blaR1
MIASWFAQGAVAEWLVKSTALVLLAWGASAVAGKAGAPAALRHLLWLLAIVAAAALPLASMLAPWRIEVLPALIGASSKDAVNALAAAPASWGLLDAVAAIYAAGCVALLLRVLIGQWQLGALWRRAANIPGIDDESAEVASALGLTSRVAVRVADGACSPMTWGVVFPKVLLPASALNWPAARRRLVLMHELAHAQRGDSLAQLFAALALAVYWFHPALWFAAARMRREQEHACDDHVLIAGAKAHDYAHTLLEVAASSRGSIGAAAVAMAPSQLEARLVAIVERSPRRPSASASALVISAAFAALLAAAIVTPANADAGALATVPMIPPGAVEGYTEEVTTGDATHEEVLLRVGVEKDLPGSPIEPERPRSPLSVTSLIEPLPEIPAIPAIPASPATPATPATPPAITTPEPHRPRHAPPDDKTD